MLLFVQLITVIIYKLYNSKGGSMKKSDFFEKYEYIKFDNDIALAAIKKLPKSSDIDPNYLKNSYN